MESLQFLENILYILSRLFFIPVVVALFVLLGYTFFAIGEFAKEAYVRFKKPDHYLGKFLKALQKETEYRQVDQYEVHMEGILIESKKRSNKKIDAARYCVKMGPTLGLVGTLTPMANALAGLSTGDLTALSGQMIAAFSTTVLGLIVGGIAFTLAHVRVKWRHHDDLILNREADKQFFNFKGEEFNETKKEIY